MKMSWLVGADMLSFCHFQLADLSHTYCLALFVTLRATGNMPFVIATVSTAQTAVHTCGGSMKVTDVADPFTMSAYEPMDSFISASVSEV